MVETFPYLLEGARRYSSLNSVNTSSSQGRGLRGVRTRGTRVGRGRSDEGREKEEDIVKRGGKSHHSLKLYNIPCKGYPFIHHSLVT